MAAIKKSAWDQTLSFLGNTSNNIATGVNNFFSGAQQIPQQIGTQISNQVASIPYIMANNARKNPPAGALPFNMNDVQKENDMYSKAYQKATPIGKLGIDSILGDGSYTPVKSESASIAPYFYNTTPAPKSNPYLDLLKQQVLSNSNLRPQAKEYLSKIPIAYSDKLPPKISGQTVINTPNSGIQNPYIEISNKFNPTPDAFDETSTVTREQVLANEKQQLEQVIQHELLHQTPRLVPVEMFQPKNQEIVNQFTNRWGKEYMNQPKALVEEMFAEQQLPPAYYWHVFKNVNPQSTKQDFVGELKSWFFNNVNNPQPAIVSGTNSGPGIMVPNSGGETVQH